MWFILAVLIPFGAASHDYQHPDNNEWYARLTQPDNTVASCCGEADAFFADKTDECGPNDYVPTYFGGCALVAIITDDREVPRRHTFPVGTRIPIPANKIRKHPSANPTEHGIVFVGPNKQVYCYEPLPLI